MELKQAILVLADISGYTRFLQLHTMSLLHAEKIITELQEAVIDATSEPLRLNKLEGDAVLFYADASPDGAATAQKVLEQTKAFFATFTARSKELTGCNNLCPCEACRQADQLRLKTILHAGEIALKSVRGFDEIAGEAVIVTHRLLKNSIAENEYILMTQAFAELCGAAERETLEARTEDCEGIGPLAVVVFYPEPREDLHGDPEVAPERRKASAILGNAFRLDAYAFARVTRMKKAPAGAADRLRRGLGFRSFASDCFRSLVMLFRKGDSKDRS